MPPIQRPLHNLLSPVGSLGLCSSPGFSVVLIGLFIPSLLLTAAVFSLIWLCIRFFRRKQIAFAVVHLVAALLPFFLFANRLIEASASEREHTSCLAILDKSGPVTNYPDVLVMRTLLWPDASAARLLLAASFREVDVIGSVPDGGEPATETITIVPGDSCRAKLASWMTTGAPFQQFLATDLSRCLMITKQVGGNSQERPAIVALLSGKFTTLQGCKGRAPRELRLIDGSRDVLVDYVDEPYTEWPIFPLLVTWRGFATNPPRAPHVSDSEFVLRNLKATDQR
jgi:hypothetical protein